MNILNRYPFAISSGLCSNEKKKKIDLTKMAINSVQFITQLERIIELQFNRAILKATRFRKEFIYNHL